MRFKRLREAARFSQNELAAATGIPAATIKNWEQNRRVPRLDHAAIVARTLGISIDELAGDLWGPPPAAAAKRRRKQ
jgi:transcriptional regulator with XRE-family HTH domain